MKRKTGGNNENRNSVDINPPWPGKYNEPDNLYISALGFNFTGLNDIRAPITERSGNTNTPIYI